MHITLDLSPAINGKAGLGRYAATLAAQLHSDQPGQVSGFANLTPAARVPAELADIPTRTIRAGYKPWRMAVWAGQMARLPFNRLIGPTDLYHATEHLLMPLRGIPTVLTVHDLIYELFPQHHRALNYHYLTRAMPLFCRRADHIIAVSECSKADLLRLYGIDPAKVTVIYEAAAPGFEPPRPDQIAAARARYSLPDRYLVHVGTIEPRKNLPRLIEALADLRREDPDLRLVCIGSMGWLTESFFEALDRFGQHEALIRPGYVPDADLPALIGGALAACQPSLYEGFGLPVIEAMAAGTPVLCSSTSALGEIAGDAALTIDPESTGEIVTALRRLLADADLRADLRGRGLRRAAEFSWARAARETWALYQRVIAARQ